MSAEFDIKGRVRRSAPWLALLRVGSRTLGVVGLLIVARLLGPAEVGIFGAGMLIISSLEFFSYPGLEAAMIQRKTLSQSSFDTVWVVQIARGALVGAILLVFAPQIAALIGEPRATSIIRFLALLPLFKGFENTYTVLFRRDLDFKRESVLHLVPAVAVFVSSVTWAYFEPTAVALVVGALAGGFVRFGASFLVQPARPQFSFDKGQLRSLFGFGRWMLASSILVFLITQGDDYVVAVTLGAASLGLYQLAYRISNTAIAEVSSTVNQMAFPLLSRLQDDPDRLGRTFVSGFSVTALVLLPMAAGIALVARPFVYAFLGDAWFDAVPVIQVLALWGAVRGLGSATSPVLQAVGRPQVIVQFQFAMFALMAVFIVPLSQAFGVLGAAMAVTVPTALVHPLRYPLISKAIGLQISTIMAPLVTPIAGVAVMAVAVLATRGLVGSITTSPVIEFGAGVAVGIVSYIGACVVVDNLRGRPLRSLVKGMVTER